MSDLKEKMAPVQGYTPGIPWAMHLEAYDAYSKKWAPQPALIDLEGRGCRGGFSTGELDDFIPGWRERLSERTALKRRVAELEQQLAAVKVSSLPDSVIAGALFDLMGFLTGGDKQYVFSARDHASPAVEALTEWATKRSINIDNADVPGWRGRLTAPIRLEESEQYRGQMAAISTASLGYWSPGDGILPEYDTAPLRDVALLYAKYALLHAKDAAQVQRELYICKGKGGLYELLGVAQGAGTSRGDYLVVYRDTANGRLYFRTDSDFTERMGKAGTAVPVNANRGEILALAEQRFGWAYGLGGFPEAIVAFSADLAEHVKLDVNSLVVG